jgi:predicted transposase/invertase (TIGR01784 family)
MGEDPSQARNYQFSSREIKELARRFDGLFIPSSDEFTDLLYFVEVQFHSKENFYRRLFAEIFIYLEQYQPPNNWAAVAIFASRNLEPQLPPQYQDLRGKLRVIYLDELVIKENLPISLGIVKLVVISEDQLKEEFPKLEQALEKISSQDLRRKVIDFIETVLFYKLSNMSRDEVSAMFGIDDLRQTRLYQDLRSEIIAEGKIEAVPRLLALGLSVKQIAGALELELALVERVAAREEARDIGQE